METEARVRWLSKLFLISISLFAAVTALPAAEYSDGQLSLEINLVSAAELKIKTAGEVSVCEADQLICRTINSAFTISQVNPEAVTWFGILDRKLSETEGVPDSTAVPKEFFAWENGKLQIKLEYLYFLPKSFSNRPEAEAYANSLGLPISKVMEIPLINSTVKLTNAKGESSYMETPLKLSFAGKMQINGGELGYEGDFSLKTVKGKLVLNQLLSLEDYLAGVVQNEIGNTAPPEALKAQAVAARTHALSLLANNRHKADGYDLCSGTHCQVYKGKYLLNSYILQAIKDCEGEALFINCQIADATYHSSCGGKTDASSAIWKTRPVAHLNGVTCIPEADSLDLSNEAQSRQWIDTKSDTAGMSSWERGALSWEKSITRAQLAANVGLKTIKRIEIVSRGRSGRILSLKLLGDKTVTLDSEYKIRQAFGNLLSSFFYIKGSYRQADNLTSINPRATLSIKGKGAGHGVGMCQVGTLRLARLGVSYTNILQHYYPGTTLSKDWKNE